MTEFPRQIFVTGTDTGVGKTVISAILCAGLDASYWKPIQGGRDPRTDTEQIRRWTGLHGERFHPERYNLGLPMSPHAAAEAEGIEILLEDFQLPKHTLPPRGVVCAGCLRGPRNPSQTNVEPPVPPAESLPAISQS